MSKRLHCDDCRTDTEHRFAGENTARVAVYRCTECDEQRIGPYPSADELEADRAGYTDRDNTDCVSAIGVDDAIATDGGTDDGPRDGAETLCIKCTADLEGLATVWLVDGADSGRWPPAFCSEDCAESWGNAAQEVQAYPAEPSVVVGVGEEYDPDAGPERKELRSDGGTERPEVGDTVKVTDLTGETDTAGVVAIADEPASEHTLPFGDEPTLREYWGHTVKADERVYRCRYLVETDDGQRRPQGDTYSFPESRVELVDGDSPEWVCAECGDAVDADDVRLLLPKGEADPDDARPLCLEHQTAYPTERLYRPATEQGGEQP